jgi:putative ABC transport system permease protein
MPVTVSWWSSLIKSMAEFRAPRFQAFLLVSFSIIGILVTKLGIYAAISFAVAARSQELAIRAALGASEKSIAANVLWRALFPVSLGIILGVGLTWVIRNSVRAQMFGFEPEVSAGLFVAAAVILAVATLAAYAPARRAGRTDPIGALKLGRSGR